MSTIKKNTIQHGGRSNAAGSNGRGSSTVPISRNEGAPMNTRLTKRLFSMAIVLLLAVAYLPAQASVVYVDVNAAGANDGTSWTDAFTDLQAVLTAAMAGDSIWVATGTYTPGGLRTDTFQLKSGVAVYGGFAGTESSISERSMAANPTTLSGDIGTPIDNTDNSYHVVTGGGTDSTAVLDGFTITAGSANEYGVEDYGAGMYNDHGSPTVVNVIFTDNYAFSGGGGMANNTSHPTLINVVFVGNSTTYAYSGGAGLNNSYSNPTLINVTFANNDAGNGYGGGMSGYYSNPTVINSIFWGNTGQDKEIYNNHSEPIVSYSVIEEGLPADCVDGGNNIADNPLFVDASSGDLRVKPTSPAVNTGNDAAVPDTVTTDVAGNPRIAGAAVDRGAYEWPCPSGNVLYVDQAATGSEDGTSWNDAFTSLQDAIEGVACENVTEIWVAAGTYKPTEGADRAATFQLINGVAIYGGFAGWESNLSERDWLTNVTTLSGDINVPINTADNSYHVTTGSGTDATAVLDGFTIAGGYANQAPAATLGLGGGMYNNPGSPTLRNLIFRDNIAVENGGGGMFNGSTSNPTLTNVTFADNATTGAGRGGGMFNFGDGKPVLMNVIFSGNSADDDGGGMENILSSPELTNVVFIHNTAGDEGGGMLNVYAGCQPTLTNVTFYGNTAGTIGGAMLNAYDTAPTVVNTIMWGNTAPSGHEVYNKDQLPTYGPGAPVFSYSLIEGCYQGGTTWDTSLGTDDGNNLDDDPLFVDAPGGDVRVSPVSPVVDAGDSTAIIGAVTTDLDGNPRVVGANVDLGAYESQSPCPAGSVLYVDANATGLKDGSTWGNAFTELRHALEWLPFCPGVTEVWVTSGTYTPTDDTNREATFRLPNGIGIYGGFVGTETDRSQRDWMTNATVLSGDIGTPAENTDNSYHVVTADGADATTILDGFTISGGNANANVTLFMLEQSARYVGNDVKPTITGSLIGGSRSLSAWDDTHGGGIYNSGGSPVFRNLIISDNYASDGGGMYNDAGSPTLENVVFRDNTGLWGGAMHNWDGSNPTLVNVVVGNGTADFGAGIYNNWSDPTLVNVTLSGGHAYRGGGIYNNLSHAVVGNAILSGDLADDAGHEIYNASASTDISYSLVEGGLTSGCNDGGGNIDADPLFVDASIGDFHLFPGSPAMDAGNNAATHVPGDDLDGNTRPVNGTVDMGAYEHQGPLCPGGSVLYVDADATGANDGSSWSDAFTDLQTAIFYRHCPGVTEMWVAAGTYKPTDGSDRWATFQLANGLAIYGGFAGIETNLSQRDWEANVTTLSGRIGAEPDNTDNSYHIVTGSGTDATAVLDGFTVTGAYAFGESGGGMYNSYGSPTLANLVFSGNWAGASGGAMQNDQSHPTLTNVTFSGNSSALGGAVCNATSNPTLISVSFLGNSGSQGGAMYNVFGTPLLINVLFSGNSAAAWGGAICNWASSPSLINVTLYGNSAVTGGGIYNANTWSTLTNAVLWGNTGGGGQIYNGGGSSTISCSLIEGCGGSGGGWNPLLGTDGGGNVDADPLFVDLAGGDLTLFPGSPCIDAGLNESIPGWVTTDLSGATRIVNGTVDMGAFEFQPACPPGTVVYVDSAATGGANNGSSWADALTDLRYALGWASMCPNVEEIWVAAGTYYPTPYTYRNVPFQLVNGVTVYGGFASGDTVLSQRDLSANITILSGNIGDPGSDTDNSYHVVTGGGTDSTAVLDGFTITGGYANGGAELNSGAGMYNSSGSPTVANVIFSDNYAYSSGGGMRNVANSKPAVTNTVFVGNSTTDDTSGGAGMGNNVSSPILVNVTFSHNEAGGAGGAMANYQSDPTVINTICWGNTSAAGNKEINNNLSTPKISYSLIEGCGGSDSWVSGFGSDFGGNLDVDPTFLDPVLGDFSLFPGSPAIDAGANDSIPPTVSTDVIGNDRIVNSTVDMGAYEFQETCPSDTVLYVDNDATGNNDGTSWADAFTELRYALGWASVCSGVDQIWVAEGTYTPTSDGDRAATLALASGLAVYGGFAGTETFRSQRDWATNATILSGNIGSPADSTDNSYHVVIGSGTDSTAVLDGFTITAGFANEAPASTLGLGGGMYNDNGSPTLANLTFMNNVAIDNGGAAIFNGNGSSPKLTDVVITGNTSTLRGGGMLNYNGSHPVLTSVTFSNNTAATYGGGMYNQTSCNPTLTDVTFIGNSCSGATGGGMTNSVGSSPTLTNVLFTGNTALDGGGMSNHGGSTPTLTDATFSYNVASGDGGGMYNNGSSPNLLNVIFTDNDADNGGGMQNEGASSHPVLVNVVFRNNTANSASGGGGGIHNWENGLTLVNATFYGNAATNGYGGAIFNYSTGDGTPLVTNTIFWANSAAFSGQQIWNNWSGPIISHSLMQEGLAGGCSASGSYNCQDGGNNIEDDPLFVNALAGDLHLSAGSPAIDAGVNDSIPPGITTDLDGNTRTVNDTVDMGAYEYQAVAQAAAFPSPLVFTSVPGNQTTCDTLYVHNNGGATCTIIGIYGCTTAPFSLDTTMTAHTIAYGETTKIVVCVTPAVAGPDSNDVVIVSDAANSPMVIPVRIEVVTAIEPDRIPKPFRIVSVSPNPFNPSTTVHFTLPSAMGVTATIWSVTGARVRVLANGQLFQPGDNRLTWDGRTDRGSPAASGVYFVRIETRLGAKVARAVLLK